MVPKNAKNGKVENLMNGEVTATNILSTAFTGDLTGDVSGNAATATLAVGVEHQSGPDILIATLTGAFGSPTSLVNGSLFTYKNTTDSKIYLVAVVDNAFYLTELTAAAAE